MTEDAVQREVLEREIDALLTRNRYLPGGFVYDESPHLTLSMSTSDPNDPAEVWTLGILARRVGTPSLHGTRLISTPVDRRSTIASILVLNDAGQATFPSPGTEVALRRGPGRGTGMQPVEYRSGFAAANAADDARFSLSYEGVAFEILARRVGGEVVVEAWSHERFATTLLLVLVVGGRDLVLAPHWRSGLRRPRAEAVAVVEAGSGLVEPALSACGRPSGLLPTIDTDDLVRSVLAARATERWRAVAADASVDSTVRDKIRSTLENR